MSSPGCLTNWATSCFAKLEVVGGRLELKGIEAGRHASLERAIGPAHRANPDLCAAILIEEHQRRPWYFVANASRLSSNAVFPTPVLPQIKVLPGYFSSRASLSSGDA